MPICSLCNKNFPNWKKIDNKNRNLQHRKYCLECSPFNQHNTRQLYKPMGVKKSQNRANGKSIYDKQECICKLCNRIYIYQRYKGHTLTTCNSCVVARSRGNLKERAIKYKGGKCEKCGYDKCVASLCFHHIDPAKKDFTIGSGYSRGWKKIKEEVDKCILLCSNCHGELHYNKYRGS